MAPPRDAAAFRPGDPFDTVVAALEHAGRSCKRLRAGRARARCPSHDDRRASLAITRGHDGRVLLKCFAGCRTSDIVLAIGLRMCDLFVPGQARRVTPRIVATYDYVNDDGELVAQKVRYAPKQFSWRRPDPTTPGRWIGNLHGVTVGLYRLPDLTDVRRVFLVEGEKAVEWLRAEGLDATCAPAGAAKWEPWWSMELWRRGCRELVVLPDADRAGREHAERVARVTWDLDVLRRDRLQVRIVPLPGLSGGADAVDWFEAGGSRTELLKIVADAPQWLPGAAERARHERRRAQTRERVRRHRERRRKQHLDDTAPVTLRTYSGNAVTV